MATGSVTLDLDGIARDAAPLGWTVVVHRGGGSYVVLGNGNVRVRMDASGEVATVAPLGWASWSIVGPLYRIIDAHTQEG